MRVKTTAKIVTVQLMQENAENAINLWLRPTLNMSRMAIKPSTHNAFYVQNAIKPYKVKNFIWKKMRKSAPNVTKMDVFLYNIYHILYDEQEI